MKFVIFSLILHISVFIFGFSHNKKYEIDNIGNEVNVTTLSVNFTSPQSSIESSIENTNESEEKEVEPIEDIVEPEIIEEKVIEEKPVEEIKIPDPDPIIEVKQDEKKIEEKKEVVKKKVPPKKKEVKKEIKKEESKENKNSSETITTNSSSDLIELSSGVFAAKNQGISGLSYKIISQPDPDYPLAAKRVSYNKEVSIKVRFLVGLNGEIEEVKFYNDKDSLGFQREVEKTLKKWKLTPVTLNNKTIKLYFYKEFKFNQK